MPSIIIEIQDYFLNYYMKGSCAPGTIRAQVMDMDYVYQ